MLYVVTGATAKTGGAVARDLLDRGVKVRAIGRSLERLQPLVGKGAEPFVADPRNPAKMADAFLGADAAWVMLQPNYIPDSQDFRAFQAGIIAAVVPALERAGVGRIVSLSSWGADKTSGTGPVAGLHDLEQALNGLSGVDLLHLRAGYFMENSLGFIPQLHGSDVVEGPFRPDLPLPWVATCDIATAAAAHLHDHDFTGRAVRELHGECDLSFDEAVAIISKALSRPAIRYSQITLDQARKTMLTEGISDNVAGLMMEVVEGINGGAIAFAEPRSERTTTPTSFGQFVASQWLPEFARVSS